MRKEQTGPNQANSTYLEHQYRQIVREVSATIHTSALNQFTFALIDSLWNDLNAVIHELERLPEATFKELLEVMEGLREAGNELRLARFLFDVEEINAVYRLMMRNRAVLRSEPILQKVLEVWPLERLSP